LIEVKAIEHLYLRALFMDKKHQQLMVRKYENAKQSLVEKILKLADCNAQAYKCCHNMRSTKTRIETAKEKARRPI